MCRLVSDDQGRTWTAGPDLVFPDMYENNNDPASRMISLAIVWQKPFRDSKGRLMAGYSDAGKEGSCFMCFDNIDEGPDIEDMKITWLLEGKPLQLPKYVYDVPRMAVEPSVVVLPDGRLFSTFVNYTGYIWYSISEDDGESWRELEVLRTRSVGNGEPLKQASTNCPIYQLDDGRYILIYQNNNFVSTLRRSKFKQPWGFWSYSQRRPVYIAVGEYRPNEDQPIWFSEPKLLADNDGVIVSLKGTNEIGNYGSFTSYKGKQVYWFTDRKFYLFGRVIDDKLLEGMSADYIL